MEKGKKTIELLLLSAGIRINGKNPHDISVHDPRFYERVLRRPSIGLGESYMEEWWDSDALDEFSSHILKASLQQKLTNWTSLLHSLVLRAFNPSRKSKAFEIGERHYDLDLDLFGKMLDRRMVYSCGYWKDAHTLDEAQEAKLDLICRKLKLEPGMEIYDIGCGWGSFCKYAAERYGVRAVGLTVSKSQAELARNLCEGYPVTFRIQDYRDIGKEEVADRIVSIGMFEHVGYKNYRTFMKIMDRLLKKDGLFLLQTIGGNESATTIDPWMGKYIFPNSMIPSIQQIGRSIEGLFVMEDWQNLCHDYDRTLLSWFRNFDTAWDELKSRFNGTFYRMWKYYLLISAGAFRARYNQLWQIVFSKKGGRGAYLPIR